MTNKIYLTPEQEAWMIKHYKHTPNEEICKRFGISLSTMQRIKRELGLSKSRQFMQKCQTNASEKAKESHLRNGTYPPKGYRVPGSENNCFKKGESNRDRLSPKKYVQCLEKRLESWRKTYDADKRRWKWDLPQKTKFRFSHQSVSKTNYRHNMKKKGYIVDVDHNICYYPSEEMRRPRAERNGAKYGIKFMPFQTI